MSKIKVQGKIDIIWKKNPTCGSNPHAELMMFGKSYKARCSGCGYDKTSTVLAEVINKMLEDNGLLRDIKKVRAAYDKKQFMFGFPFYDKNGKAYMDGGYGENATKEAAKLVGVTLKRISRTDISDNFTLEISVKEENDE